jgi:hypothetical protein
MTDQPRSFDEWFKNTWDEIVKVDPVPGLDEIKNRVWMALDEKETISCPHCGRKYPGDAVPYSVVTEHAYKCKQNPAREVAILLAELWNANVMQLQDETVRPDMRAFESKVAPLLSRWGFGAAQATVDEPTPPREAEYADDPEYPIRREGRVFRKDDVYPNWGTVKNHVRIGPSDNRQPAYCVEWEDGAVSNILVEHCQSMKAV